jgi:methyltransferase-like protein
MLLKLHGITNPRERVRIARDQLDWLASNLPDGGPYGPAFAATLAEARAASNALLIHDWIAPHNTPIHFFRFAMRAERHGLAYLCEADPALAADHSPTPAGDAARARSPSELVFAEQLYDFLTNRRFRRTLVCRREAPPARVLDVHVVDSMYVSTRARPVDPDVDPKGDAPATFRSPEGEMTTNHVPTKLAMDLLVRATPGAMSFKEIERAVGDALGPADDAARGLEELRENLVTAFLSSSGVVELRAFAPPCVARAGERPAASPWARHLARTAHRVPNLRHEMVDLNEPVRRFLVKVDGTRDRAALVPELVLLANEGLLRDAAGQPARPGPKAVDEVLAQLARVALLMA